MLNRRLGVNRLVTTTRLSAWRRRMSAYAGTRNKSCSVSWVYLTSWNPDCVLRRKQDGDQAGLVLPVLHVHRSCRNVVVDRLAANPELLGQRSHRLALRKTSTKLVGLLDGDGRFPALVLSGSLREGDPLALAFQDHGPLELGHRTHH